MSHFAFQGREVGTLELDTDVVVVGSGAGGSAAASTLARGGLHVTIVEAGAWRDPQDYPGSMVGTMRDVMDDWGSLLAKGRAFWPIVQARTVGGTTVINSAIVVRTPGDVFAQWQDELGFGGDALAERVWAKQDVIEQELYVSPVPRETWGRSNELAEAGAKQVGLHDHDMRRNVRDCEGHGFCLQGCRRGRKQSTNLNYVPEVLARRGAVLSCAPVDKVRLEGTRAVGVEGRFVHPLTRKKGARFVVRARKAVVVAASATHSPVLLMRSGIKHPALGHGFRAHPGTGVFGVYDDPVDMNTGATQGWASTKHRLDLGLKLETLSIPIELVASRLSGAGAPLMERLKGYRHLAMWIMAVRAEAVGRVKKGFGGGPAVKYGMTRRDMETLRKGAHLVAQMHVAAGAKALHPGVHGMPTRLKPGEIDKLLEAPLDPRRWTAILSHLFGGCTMGTDERRSVCDPRGRVRGVEGLIVADASAIPTTLGVNPQHTIMALARCRAEEILGAA